MEPLACCIHGIDQLNIKIGGKALVVGLGPIGLLMCQLLQINRLEVIGVDISNEKINAAKELEIGCYHTSDEELKKEGTFNYIVETTGGYQSAITMCLEFVRKGGEILFFSVPKGEALIDLTLVFEKELHIHGSFINPGTNQRALNLIHLGMINLEGIISHRFDLNRYQEALEIARSGMGRKIILKN